MFSVRFWKKGDVLVVNKFFFEWRFERDGRSQEVGLIQPQQCPPSGRIFMPREDRTSGGPSAVAFEPDHVNMLSHLHSSGRKMDPDPQKRGDRRGDGATCQPRGGHRQSAKSSQPRGSRRENGKPSHMRGGHWEPSSPRDRGYRGGS